MQSCRNHLVQQRLPVRAVRLGLWYVITSSYPGGVYDIDQRRARLQLSAKVGWFTFRHLAHKSFSEDAMVSSTRIMDLLAVNGAAVKRSMMADDMIRFSEEWSFGSSEPRPPPAVEVLFKICHKPSSSSSKQRREACDESGHLL